MAASDIRINEYKIFLYYGALKIKSYTFYLAFLFFVGQNQEISLFIGRLFWDECVK